MDIIEQKLVDTLYIQRNQLIQLMVQQVRLVKQSYDLCHQMDKSILAHSNANYDYLDIIFIQFKSLLGEKARQPMPSDVNVLSLSVNEAQSIFTNVLDQNLWLILFNRLNVFSLMSNKAKQAFNKNIKKSVIEFTPDNVRSTLKNIYKSQDEMIYQGLIESIQSADTSYASNDGFKFNKRTIFSDVTTNRYEQVKLNSASNFLDTLTFLSKIVFGGETVKTNKDTHIENVYLISLVLTYFEENNLDRLDRDQIDFSGGKIVFFNNGKAHLFLEQETINFLNNALSNKNYLVKP